jgi:hypothetical protein
LRAEVAGGYYTKKIHYNEAAERTENGKVKIETRPLAILARDPGENREFGAK